MIRAPAVAVALALLAAWLPAAAVAQPAPKGEGAGKGESTNGLDMQAARGALVTKRGRLIAYTKRFDLSGIPAYTPHHQVSGVIRLWGSNYITDGMVGGYWETAFKTFHPGVTFEWRMETAQATIPALAFGVADISIGRSTTFAELELYERLKNHDPLTLDIATGSYDVPGWNPGFGVVVNKDNPLDRITVDQLDGIFGAERSGGWDGTSWRPQYARGPEKNIRTWGQMGLKGEWGDQPINAYGLNLRYHQATTLSDRVLKSSDKWNEHMRTYANYVAADGQLSRSMNADLAADRYGIGIVASPTTDLARSVAPTQKILPVAQTAAGPYVAYTLETVQDRTYPLYDHIFAYADAAPGKAADPKAVEFLRFILSREGQEAIERDGKYLPLTASVAKQGLAQLDKVDP